MIHKRDGYDRIEIINILKYSLTIRLFLNIVFQTLQMQSGIEFNIDGKSPDFYAFFGRYPKAGMGKHSTGGQSTKKTSSITMLDRSVEVVCRN